MIDETEAQMTDEDPLTKADREVAEAENAVSELEDRYVDGDADEAEIESALEEAQRQSRFARLRAKRARRQQQKAAQEQRQRDIIRLRQELLDELATEDAEIADLYAKARKAVNQLVDGAVKHADERHRLLEKLEYHRPGKQAAHFIVGDLLWNERRTEIRSDGRHWMPETPGRLLVHVALCAAERHPNRTDMRPQGRDLRSLLGRLTDGFREPKEDR